MNPPNELLGRILRGKTEDDFSMLSEDPFRRVVLLFGDDGFERMQNLPPYDQLLAIGYSRDYIRELMAEGYSFRLVAFPQGDTTTFLGTWENLIPVIRSAYPYLEHLVTPELVAQCAHIPFTEFERTAGFSFSEVRRAGKSDHRYMTSERYSQSEPTALNLRRFLHDSLHLRELYRGDGYTWQDTGVRGVREYFMKNTHIADIKGVTITQLEVVVP